MASPRKLLFLLFSDDECRQNHALMYVLDLHAKGYDVKLIVEGPATRLLGGLAATEEVASRPATLLRNALESGIVAGACARASAGCATGDPARDVADPARAARVPLLSELAGHAGIEPYVREGYEIVVM